MYRQAGLVSITAACNVVSFLGATGIGSAGGVIYILGKFVVKVLSLFFLDLHRERILLLKQKKYTYELKKLQVDDPIDVFVVHVRYVYFYLSMIKYCSWNRLFIQGLCGIWGVLAVPIFGSRIRICLQHAVHDCMFAGNQFLAQVIGILAIVLWTLVCICVLQVNELYFHAEMPSNIFRSKAIMGILLLFLRYLKQLRRPMMVSMFCQSFSPKP